MEDKFAWMSFGDGEVAPARSNTSVTSSPDHRVDDPDDADPVPIFLREDGGATVAAEAPSFLADYHGEGDPDKAPAYPGPLGLGALQQRRCSSSPTAVPGKESPTAGRAKPEGLPMSAPLYADQPSASELNFVGDSGCTWSLHRVRILGKGNYGCATLYTTEGLTLIADGAKSRNDGSIVVKDINMQTMTNVNEEVAAVQNELGVLRSVKGHPNLVQYVDALFDTRPSSFPMSFILMEYCGGGDVAAVLEGRHCGFAVPPTPESAPVTATGIAVLSEAHVAALFIQTAVALQSLHTEYGILHRDVKPHNIFLLEDGITVRLGDFGVSVQLSRIGEKAKEACGSPYYMAPELFEERAYGAAADVWSLGVVFYEVVARQLPFTASSAAELRSLVCRGRYTPLPELHSESAACYSRELKELISSLLTVDAEARPTLRRVLRQKYVREHLKHVPVDVLTASKPIWRSAGTPSTGTHHTPATRSTEGLYAGIFGEDVVAQAVAKHGRG